MVLGAGVAYAYWTSTGSGQGSAATASGTGGLAVHQISTITGLTPGASIALTGNYDNNTDSAVQVPSGGLTAFVDSVTPVPAAGAVPCTPDNFVISGTSAGPTSVPVGMGSANWSGLTVSLANMGVNQDACKSAVAHVVYTVGDGFKISATGSIVGANDIGGCNNIWAQTSTDKTFMLTRINSTTYNLIVKSKGTFVTNAGTSPGACNATVAGGNPTSNGSTVAAGITGATDQTYNGTVTSSVVPAHVTGTYADTTPFLNAVFGGVKGVAYTTQYQTNGGYGWIGHYETPSNGSYLDRDSTWPNNIGDIK